jgi:hypothetical protein
MNQQTYAERFSGRYVVVQDCKATARRPRLRNYVKNGKWFERGEMGWWACVSNEKDEQTWRSIYTNLIKDLPDDTLLSVYDCHI